MIEVVGGAIGSEDRAWIEANLRRACETLGSEPERLAVRVADDDEMRRLHARFCGIDSTTDVLTFVHSAPGAPVDADVAIGADEARRQSERRGHALREELLLYAIHGLLHARGHDDRAPQDFERMHREEDRLLDALGVRARFAEPDGGRA